MSLTMQRIALEPARMNSIYAGCFREMVRGNGRLPPTFPLFNATPTGATCSSSTNISTKQMKMERGFS
ncbi:MAG: hypothetical protein R6X34_26975 [Chloroflexota bacterium]